jgi:hypothetical protein
MPKTLDVTFLKDDRSVQRSVSVESCVVAGWTGRNAESVLKHIRELEALGVKPPSSTPIFYRVSADRITTADMIEALGDDSSGEAEFVLLKHGGEFWVGAGSDHTDRGVEAYSVAVSKQLCDKPIGSTFWPLSEIVDHWDRMRLESHILEAGERVLYQSFDVSGMMLPATLLALCADATKEGALMFCGTSAVIGKVRPSASFEYSLADPVLGRMISGRYAIRRLDVAQ